MSELRLKNSNLNAWIERFELFVLLNEINVHTEQLIFLTLFDNYGYLLLRDLCMPLKSKGKKYYELKNILIDCIIL